MPADGFSHDFIIRIYRRRREQKPSFVGIVEKIGQKGKRAFNTRDELWEILFETPQAHDDDSGCNG